MSRFLLPTEVRAQSSQLRAGGDKQLSFDDIRTAVQNLGTFPSSTGWLQSLLCELQAH